MSSHELGNPRLTQDDGDWVLVIERIVEHPCEEVWAALTQSEQIPSWGPFTTNRDLNTIGDIRLAHINMPEADEMHGYVLEVNEPQLLVFRWGADILRWELSSNGDKTLLILRHRFADRHNAPSFAAGWHLCLDGLAGTLDGEKMPSMAGQNAFKYGWQELYDRYAQQMGISST